MMKQTLTVAALAACAAWPGWAQDGVLHVYNWSDYIAEDTLEKFTAETGIEVVYDVYDSNEVLEAKLLAGSSGYDIVVPTSSFLKRQVEAGVYLPLDKAKLPSFTGLDAGLMEAAATYDPGNEHAAIYLWGTVGLGFSRAAVEERLGADAPVDSWSLIFDPANAEKLADCGISLLDSATDMLPIALNYLGLEPSSTDPDELEQAAQLLNGLRPHVRYFHSSQYISDLANGEVCVSVGWSGDVFIAAERAAEAGTGIEVGYSIPKEGTLQWFDMMAIPVDAPNPEAAHAFMDFILRPEIIADVTGYVYFPNAVLPASLEHVDPEIASNPAIFPPAELLAELFPSPIYGQRDDRVLTRLWTQLKTGQ